MTDTTKPPPNRRAAAEAARKLLAPGIQHKVDLVAELADAAHAAIAAEEAFQTAERHVQACRTAYTERYRAALSGGWSDAELAQIDLPVEFIEQGPRRPPRPRTPAKAPTKQPSAPPEDGPPKTNHGAPDGQTNPAPAGPGAADTPVVAPQRRPGRRPLRRRCRRFHDRRRACGRRTTGGWARSVDGSVPPRRPVCGRFRRAVRSVWCGFSLCPAARSAMPWTAGGAPGVHASTPGSAGHCRRWRAQPAAPRDRRSRREPQR
jgi:hypothetical protein